jgi:glutamate-1-semialdehyde 2,1-aminomutase
MPDKPKPYEPRDEDRLFYERELASFIPGRVFDAHCHLWTAEADEFTGGTVLPTAGYADYVRLIDALHPGRHVAGLFLSYAVTPEKIKLMNAWTAEQTAKAPDCRGAFFVRPTDDPEWVRQEVRRLKLHGLKCYHVQSPKKPTWEADIPEFLPEPLVKLADQEGWTITLHIVKSRGIADPSNIHWVRRYCTTYPNMKLILAHSARGFQPAHNFEGLPQLTGLDNLYFDTSANCDAMAHASIIRIIGAKKLMYGSDFMVSHLRGRSVPASNSFLWFYEQTPVWGEKYATIPPMLVGLEHLRSLKWACWAERLSDNEVEDVFWNNAADLFGLPRA